MIMNTEKYLPFVFKKAILAMSLCFLGLRLAAQCPSGTVYLNSQAAVASFVANYPNCTEITGNLIISGAGITDVSVLDNKVKKVTGILSISNTSLAGLNGLKGIESVGSSVSISNNDSLTSLQGLSGLSSIGNGLSISGNDALLALDGLANLSALNGLSINANSKLEDISAFSHWEEANFNITIGNNKLSSLYGLHNLTSGKNITITESALTDLLDFTKMIRAERITIQNNENIESLAGLSNLSSLNELLLSGMTGLKNLNNFPKVSSLDRLKLQGLKVLDLQGMESLQELATFELIDCTSLVKFTGISNLERITTSFSITNCALTDFTGAENIKSLSSLNLDTCNSLTTLSGVSQLNSIVYLGIKNVPNITNLTGVSNVSSIGKIAIEGCDGLTSLSGLAQNSTETIEIKSSANLPDLAGLDAFTTLKEIAVENCSGFRSLQGIHNLNGLEKLSLRNTGLVSMTGFPKLTSIANLLILDNKSLVSVTGFESLTDIGRLNISGNALKNLDGLQNLVSLNGGNDVNIDHYLAEEQLVSVNLSALRTVNGNYWSLYLPNTSEVCGLVNYATYGTRPSFFSFYADSGKYTSFDSVKTACGIQCTVSLFLEGAMKNPSVGEEHLMRDDLRAQGLVPERTPFSDAISTTASRLAVTGETAVVDWVEIQLRDASDQTKITAAKSFLITRSGSLVDVESNTTNLFFAVPSGDYYLAVFHRNHLGVITSNPMSLSAITTAVDLSDSSNLKGGEAAVRYVYTSSGGQKKYALIAGDTDNNGQIQNTDMNRLVQKLGSAGYTSEDLDLNGQIQNIDITKVLHYNMGAGEQF